MLKKSKSRDRNGAEKLQNSEVSYGAVILQHFNVCNFGTSFAILKYAFLFDHVVLSILNGMWMSFDI